jgi:hypothetical protein
LKAYRVLQGTALADTDPDVVYWRRELVGRVEMWARRKERPGKQSVTEAELLEAVLEWLKRRPQGSSSAAGLMGESVSAIIDDLAGIATAVQPPRAIATTLGRIGRDDGVQLMACGYLNTLLTSLTIRSDEWTWFRLLEIMSSRGTAFVTDLKARLRKLTV